LILEQVERYVITSDGL